MDAHATVKLHTVMAAVWAVLLVATTAWALWDPENKALMAWVIAMSAYANFVGHLSAKAGAGPSEGENERS